MNTHLDEDAFAELMMGGSPGPKARAHLESCGWCRAEAAKFRDAVNGFAMASLAWSEERSEQLPALRPSLPERVRRPAGLGYPWIPVGALAVLLAIGVAVPVAMRHDAGLQAMNDDVAGLNSPEQIAKDNQLMANVNMELERSRLALAAQYDSDRSESGGRAAARKRR